MVKRMFLLSYKNTHFYSLSLSLSLSLNYLSLSKLSKHHIVYFSLLFLSHYHLQSAEVRLLSCLLLTVLTELNICFLFVFLNFKCVSLSSIWIVVWNSDTWYDCGWKFSNGHFFVGTSYQVSLLVTPVFKFELVQTV